MGTCADYIVAVTNDTGDIMTWQEEEVLDLFTARGALSGVPIPLKAILFAWGARADVKEFWVGLDGLIARGLVGKNEKETALFLC